MENWNDAAEAKVESIQGEMETSGPKGWWKSEMDQVKKGEIEKIHLRMEQSSI